MPFHLCTEKEVDPAFVQSRYMLTKGMILRRTGSLFAREVLSLGLRGEVSRVVRSWEGTAG
jgi:hypothetical protein